MYELDCLKHLSNYPAGIVYFREQQPVSISSQVGRVRPMREFSSFP